MAAPRILIAGGGTGGHLYPALNLAAALRKAEPGAEVLLLGARRGVEARVLPETGWPYRLLPLQPLHRSRPWRNWRLLASAPAVVGGLREAFRELDPGLVVGTGGYASGPAVLWGRLTGRRTAIQEQNAEPGLATRLLAPRVDQVHLGHPEAEARLRPGRGTEVFAFGNPVARPEGGPREARTEFAWPEGRVLLVSGGSQGARGLNRRLLEDLEAAAVAAPGPSAREGPGGPTPVACPGASRATGWPRGWSMVWLAGPAHAAEVEARAAALPWADRIRVLPFLPDLGARLGAVSLAIARAGAMFVAELAAAGVPAILVPFPAAAGGHQSANARAMAAGGAAAVREEAELAPGELWDLARGLMTDEEERRRMAAAARERGAPEAADRIAAELLRLVAR